MSNGQHLPAALASAGYRTVRAAQINLKGSTHADLLAKQAVEGFCRLMLDSELREVGMHQRGDQTWLVLAVPFSPPVASQADDVQARVLALVNKARAESRRCGSNIFAATRPLRSNATLQSLATIHAQDMARHNYFSHTGRDGSTVDVRASRAGYPWRSIGENIAAGQMHAEAAVQSWLSSPGHCVNIMSPEFTEMGLAYAVNNKSRVGIYWVQVLGAAQ